MTVSAVSMVSEDVGFHCMAGMAQSHEIVFVIVRMVTIQMVHAEESLRKFYDVTWYSQPPLVFASGILTIILTVILVFPTLNT